MIQIQVRNQEEKVIAEAGHEEEALLCVDHKWEEGDTVVLHCPENAHMMLSIDASMLQGEVFLPSGEMHWQVPAGEHRLAYMPGLFDGKRHIISARIMGKNELMQVRDLAKNPLDLRGETNFYPHCTANVETRGESVFAARNVIDGLRFNSFHGEWPFESWGIGAREDAWCLLNFGREIVAERMAVTLRADFPHDAYWICGYAVDSNGEEIAFNLEKTGERQWINLGGRKIQWLRLERMIKSDDPSAFPSLRSWEVYGREADS